MKKDEAVHNLEEAGYMINDLYVRAWETALYPTQHGWGKSIAHMAMIPILSAASVGQFVSTAVAKQVPADVYDNVSNLINPKKSE